MNVQDPTPQALKAAQAMFDRYGSRSGLTVYATGTIAHIIDESCNLHELNAVVEAARAVLREDRGPEPPVYLNRRLNALGEALDALPGPQNPSDRTKPPPEA